MYLDIEIYRGDDNIFVAACPELNLFSHADTQDEAVEMLKQNILHYMEQSQTLADTREDIEFSLRYYYSRLPQTH